MCSTEHFTTELLIKFEQFLPDVRKKGKKRLPEAFKRFVYLFPSRSALNKHSNMKHKTFWYRLGCWGSVMMMIMILFSAPRMMKITQRIINNAICFHALRLFLRATAQNIQNPFGWKFSSPFILSLNRANFMNFSEKLQINIHSF